MSAGSSWKCKTGLSIGWISRLASIKLPQVRASHPCRDKSGRRCKHLGNGEPIGGTLSESEILAKDLYLVFETQRHAGSGHFRVGTIENILTIGNQNQRRTGSILAGLIDFRIVLHG